MRFIGIVPEEVERRSVRSPRMVVEEVPGGWMGEGRNKLYQTVPFYGTLGGWEG